MAHLLLARLDIPQNPAYQSDRGGLSLRPVGGHPADHPLFFLLLLALVWQVCLREPLGNETRMRPQSCNLLEMNNSQRF